jgi:molybdopterin molybdotransferase
LIERLERETGDRFEAAAELNRRLGVNAFWGGSLSLTRPEEAGAVIDKRWCEREQRGVQSPFKLAGIGSVGSQTLTGIPVLERLRRALGAKVWPFEDIAGARVVIAEVWPRLAKKGGGRVLDERQVRGLVEWLPLQTLEVPRAWRKLARQEGWIVGVPFPHEPPQVFECRGRGAAPGLAPRKLP